MIETQFKESSENTLGYDSLAGFDTANYARLFNDFFGFTENPFSNTPDPHFFYMSRQHQEALTSMSFGVEERRGFIAITGEVGAGKTTLCRQFLSRLSPDIKIAVVLNSNVSASHLLASIAQDFGIPVKGRGKRGVFDALNKFLLDGIEYNKNACIMIDEAQCLGVKVLEEIRLLTNLETSKQKLLQVVLTGQPELRDLLMKPSLRQLRQRIGVYVHLKGFDEIETQNYIFHRLGRACQGQSHLAFDPEVTRRTYQISRGIPRLINTLCDRILMSAYSKQTRNINMNVAGEAFEELAFICDEAQY